MITSGIKTSSEKRSESHVGCMTGAEWIMKWIGRSSKVMSLNCIHFKQRSRKSTAWKLRMQFPRSPLNLRGPAGSCRDDAQRHRHRTLLSLLFHNHNSQNVELFLRKTRITTQWLNAPPFTPPNPPNWRMQLQSTPHCLPNVCNPCTNNILTECTECNLCDVKIDSLGRTMSSSPLTSRHKKPCT